ncbi:hypothetical protein Tco_1303889 [Tanacetum coccineum]
MVLFRIATMDLASYGVEFKRDGDSFGWLGTVNEGESDGDSEQGFMAGKWHIPTSPKADKPKKSTPVKKPAPAKQTKPVKEKSTKPTPSKKASKGKVRKVQKGKSSLKLVDEPDEEPQPSPEPQIKDDEYNLQIGVVQSLPVVEGKGKAIATDEHVAQSLMELQQPKGKSTTDQYIFQRRTPVNEETSIGPLAQLEDDTSANIVCDTQSPPDAETSAEVEMSDSKGDTKILNVGKEKGEDVSNTLFLEERKVKLDEGQAGSDLDPPSSSGTLSSMKNLDDAFTYGDQFLYEKPTEVELNKANVEIEIESMVTVPIHQISSLAPPLSIPIIVISSPKPVSPPIQEPVFTATTTTITTTLPPPPPPPQQQSTTDFALAARVTTQEQICANFEKKNKVQDQTTHALSTRIFMLENHDLYSKIDKYINENIKEVVQNALKAPPEHTALYDALEASMDHENREDFMDTTAKPYKRRRDDQDPPSPPPKGSDQSKKTSSSKQKTAPQSKQPVDDVPILDDAHISDSEDTGAAHLPKIKPRPNWLKPIPEEERLETPKLDWTGDMGSFIKWYCKQIRKKKLSKADLEDQINLVNPEGNRVVPDVSKPLPLGGPPGQVTIQQQYFINKDLEYLVSGDKERRNPLSISKLKAAYYPDFGLE